MFGKKKNRRVNMNLPPVANMRGIVPPDELSALVDAMTGYAESEFEPDAIQLKEFLSTIVDQFEGIQHKYFIKGFEAGTRFMIAQKGRGKHGS
jgi:hypothetical protein